MMATHRHLRVAFLPFVQVIVKTRKSSACPDHPGTLGEHLKKRRYQLKLRQKDAAKLLGIDHLTYINWEKGHTQPYAHSYPAIIAFLGYDPAPNPTSLPEWIVSQRRKAGLARKTLAELLGWDEATLYRYEAGVWPLKAERLARLEEFFRARQTA
jgi:transcriptional regulator with XRE-family HTH domain